MSHRWVHYPLPSPPASKKQNSRYNTLLPLRFSNRLFVRLFFNWRKNEKDQQCQVSCSAHECSSLQHSDSFSRDVRGRGSGAVAVECVCTGTVRCKACDFPRGNQAIRVQGRPYDCWKLLHFKVHVHKKLATEEKVNSKTYCGGRAVSIVQILKGTEVCRHYPKITSQASYSDELLQTLSIKLILCQ